MLLRRLFGKLKEPERVLAHPEFGRLVFSKRDGWVNEAFELWGFSDVQLLVTAGEDGPTREQVRAFRAFRDAKGELLPRCLAQLAGSRQEMGLAPSRFAVSCLSIPALDSSTAGNLWTLWFDCEGDDHYMYGVQTEDDWATTQPFVDD